MIFTKEILERGRSLRGGWSRMQLTALGVSDFKKGWIKKIMGTTLPADAINKFIALKDSHVTGLPKNKPPKNKQKFHYPSFEPCRIGVIYKDQYIHPNWQKMRLFILNRDKFTCVNCFATDRTLHVHHLKYILKDFIWKVPHWYLVTLCDICHSREHSRDLTIKK